MKRVDGWIGVIVSIWMLTGCNSDQATYAVGGEATGVNGKVVLQNRVVTKSYLPDVGSGDPIDYNECEPPPFQTETLAKTSLGKRWSKDGIDYTSMTEKLTVAREGDFVFKTKHPEGAEYNVTILSAPAGAECTLQNASGVIHKTDITSIRLACRGPVDVEDEEEPPATNQPPVAEAGEDRYVGTEGTVSIAGSGTDSDGSIAAYEWKEGSTVLAATATFTYTAPDDLGDHTLTLVVTDDDGATGADTMTVHVVERPIAQDGVIYVPEYTDNCTVGVEAHFQLDGYDPGGADLTFVKVTDPDYGKATVRADGSATFVLETESDRNSCLKQEENTFTFKVNNGRLDSEPATFYLETHNEE